MGKSICGECLETMQQMPDECVIFLALHVFLGNSGQRRAAKRAQMTSNCSCDTNKKEAMLCSVKKISHSN